MTHVFSIRRSLPFAAALSLLALGFDSPKQMIDAGGMTFDAPKTWKSTKPSSPFRRAQLSVTAAKGDKEGAELVVTSFPGDAGGVDANVKRWESQCKDKDGNPSKATVAKKKGQNVDVVVVEAAGHYVAAAMPGRPEVIDKEGYRLLGAIVQGSEGSFFFKMIGPDKTVLAAKEGFNELISSIRIKGT